MDARVSMSRASLRGGPGHPGSVGGRVAEGVEQPLHQGRDPGLLRALPLGGQGVEPDLRKDGMEVVLLQQLGAAERQHVPAGQLRPQVIGPLLRLLGGPRRPDGEPFPSWLCSA